MASLEDVYKQMLKKKDPPRDPWNYPHQNDRQPEIQVFHSYVYFEFQSIGVNKKRYSARVRLNKSGITPYIGKRNDDGVVVDRDSGYLYKLELQWSKTPVQLKCDCPDFRFTWEYPLHKNKALIGNWRRYKDHKGGKPRNAKNLMGVCKHLHHCIDFMIYSKMFTDIRGRQG